jgi:hypothetical protein
MNLPPAPRPNHYEVRNAKGQTLLCEASPNGEIPWEKVRQDAAALNWGYDFVALSERQLWAEYEAAKEDARLASRSPEKISQDERDRDWNRERTEAAARWNVQNHAYTRRPTTRGLDPNNSLI